MNWNAEALGQDVDVDRGDVADAALDTGDIRRVEPSS